MLASFAVTNTSDAFVDGPGDAPGTLRQAIFDADLTPEADTIDFDIGAGPALISLTEGELLITYSLTISGLGAALLTIDASGSDPTPDETNGDGKRIFNIAPTSTDVHVSISGLSLTGGDEPDEGGAIRSVGANLQLSGLKIYQNGANIGGGIYAVVRDGGEVRIAQTQVIENEARDGAGIFGVNGGTTVSEVAGHFLIQESVISANRAEFDGGGAYLTSSVDVLPVSPSVERLFTIERCAISGNIALVNGGGLHADFGVSPTLQNYGIELLHLSDSTISNNKAYGAGGTVTTPSTDLRGGGGGIYLTAGTVSPNHTSTIINSTISGNRALNGGGILISGTGGGINRTTFRHTTITNNTAGPFLEPSEQPFAPALSKEFQPTAGGGFLFRGFLRGDDSSQLPSFDHTIVALNTHNGQEPSYPPDPRDHNEINNPSPDIGVDPLPIETNEVNEHNRPLTDEERYYVFNANYSLFGDLGRHAEWNVFTVAGTGNKFGDPLLDPLADNGAWFTLPDGSKIQTHALRNVTGEVSPAIDAGDPSFVPPPQYDQRGLPYGRVIDIFPETEVRPGDIDIGAFEFQAIIPEPCPPGDYNDNEVVDAADYVVWRKNLNQPVDLPNDPTPGSVDDEDYNVWRMNFDATCEDESSSDVALDYSDGSNGSPTGPSSGERTADDSPNRVPFRQAVVPGTNLVTSPVARRAMGVRFPAAESSIFDGMSSTNLSSVRAGSEQLAVASVRYDKSTKIDVADDVIEFCYDQQGKDSRKHRAHNVIEYLDVALEGIADEALRSLY
jgi:hypothetical protein